MVKLGADAQLTVADAGRSSDLFKATLNVLQGPFRFTTDVVAKPRPKAKSASAPHR